MEKTRTSEFFKDYQKTYECVFFSNCTKTMPLLINNIHDKMMQNHTLASRANLFTSDCQYFHNEKTFVTTTEVKQCVIITNIFKITKIALFGTVFP